MLWKGLAYKDPSLALRMTIIMLQDVGNRCPVGAGHDKKGWPGMTKGLPL